jgi:hypothetical protein
LPINTAPERWWEYFTHNDIPTPTHLHGIELNYLSRGGYLPLPIKVTYYMLHFMNRNLAGAKRQLVWERVSIRKDTACYGKGQQGAVYERPEAESHWRAPPGSWLCVWPGSESPPGNEELGRKIWLV